LQRSLPSSAPTMPSCGVATWKSCTSRLQAKAQAQSNNRELVEAPHLAPAPCRLPATAAPARGNCHCPRWNSRRSRTLCRLCAVPWPSMEGTTGEDRRMVLRAFALAMATPRAMLASAGSYDPLKLEEEEEEVPVLLDGPPRSQMQLDGNHLNLLVALTVAQHSQPGAAFRREDADVR